MENKKTCTICNIEKELDKFSKQKSGKNGVRSNCKLCLKEKDKEYRENNKEKEKLRSKEYRDKNKEKEKLRKIKYRLENPEKTKNIRDNWVDKNPNYHKEYKLKNKVHTNERNKRRKVDDNLYRLSCVIRSCIARVLKQNGFTKKGKTYEILKCSFEEFKIHIEDGWSLTHNLTSNGKVWMSWDNYGKPKDNIYGKNKTWELDHIIPLCSAINEEELLKLNNYTNIQPLCSHKNRSLGRKGIFK